MNNKLTIIASAIVVLLGVAGDVPSAQAFVAVAQRLMQTAAPGGEVKCKLQFFLRRMLAAR